MHANERQTQAFAFVFALAVISPYQVLSAFDKRFVRYQLSVIGSRITDHGSRITDHEPLRLLVILVPTLLQIITIIPFIGDHLTMINRKDP